jgi:hypothetical protein
MARRRWYWRGHEGQVVGAFDAVGEFEQAFQRPVEQHEGGDHERRGQAGVAPANELHKRAGDETSGGGASMARERVSRRIGAATPGT